MFDCLIVRPVRAGQRDPILTLPKADKMASANRRLMAGTRGGSGVFGASTHRGQGVAGFVSASVAAEAPPLAKGVHGADIDDSDDDLFAPGVTASFGRGARPQAPKQQRAAAKARKSCSCPIPRKLAANSNRKDVDVGSGRTEDKTQHRGKNRKWKGSWK